MNNLMSNDRIFARLAPLQDAPKVTVTVWSGQPGSDRTESPRELFPVAAASGRRTASPKTVN
ncbi:hypothetical protein [Labrenzia sp. VG12]|uniref:hypothetical protein n=1 Tax=Labrenzia sp. VG12 TaxID=2021862 RepID=UPI000B8BB6C2|nr:hypothetical protein [Labrenzia sp. VG12]ASP33450.1 hypothetical protein CHH27_09500 [Labrenzia sp. VG12]